MNLRMNIYNLQSAETIENAKIHLLGRCTKQETKNFFPLNGKARVKRFSDNSLWIFLGFMLKIFLHLNVFRDFYYLGSKSAEFYFKILFMSCFEVSSLENCKIY